ncbi:class I SAM-dependent methyltransferase [Dermatophilus congolensis]|nr:class I SAM-dependent methyltransferase [Dermatophilus congolensis]MBO3161943.1 class I SAM-dependent methyltransferase [Dermatophilus congolensis]MBO3175893.1 class I SAM-dependent methyltransferase [Dermatophilus congolensis]MBO3182651.1 class I SAM-dependent methyltransferase [Dermatophilus congolensis]MBO3202498.1 class I SAM-dependent methyltransferase [Dermatophilus congolensis]MBO3205172.1 class I SAM-dependent methyltransferase [Dermatophilus congolensis]
MGEITRGTTNPNRLRRCDRWLASMYAHLLTRRNNPIWIVDLGYGASPITTLDMANHLASHPDIARPPHTANLRIRGLEIDPQRVHHANTVMQERKKTRHPEPIAIDFALGGFETPLPNNAQATVIRAFNVLRQYDEKDVPQAWKTLCSRLTPEGIAIDGTCNELGRRTTWITLNRSGPIHLTISIKHGAWQRPSDIAERLPKALIHHNIPGTRINAFLTDWDDVWARNSHHATFGQRQWFIAACADLRDRGWPLLHGPRRWRLGEVTIRWDAVAP